jgi:hypothetical protein
MSKNKKRAKDGISTLPVCTGATMVAISLYQLFLVN